MDISAGTWRKGKLMKGIQLFPKNMTIHYFERKIDSSKDLHVTVNNLDADDITMQCKPSSMVEEICNKINVNLFDEYYEYSQGGQYEGQLESVRGNDPIRDGFGHLFDKHTGNDYIGFWEQNWKQTFGVDKQPLFDFYAGIWIHQI